MSVEAIGQKPTMVLPERLAMATVGAVHGELIDRLAAGGGLVLDGGGVQQADAAGVQLLLAARQAAASRGRAFRLSASAALVDAARVLGLAGVLEPVSEAGGGPVAHGGEDDEGGGEGEGEGEEHKDGERL